MEHNVGPHNGYTLELNVGTMIGGSTFDMVGNRFSSADVLGCARVQIVRVVHASLDLRSLEFPNPKMARQKAIGVVYLDQIRIHDYVLIAEHGLVIQ